MREIETFLYFIVVILYMKLRELYQQKTDFSLISGINYYVKRLFSPRRLFGVRRLSTGILTVFWLLVWTGILFTSTYIITLIPGITLPETVLSAWTAFTSDIITIGSSPVGLATGISSIYGLSIYIRLRGMEQLRKNTTKDIPSSVVLSLIITGLGYFILYNSTLYWGVLTTIGGGILTARYVRKMSVLDEKIINESYDIYKINAIIRSCTLWSVIYAIAGQISYITVIPIGISSIYTIQYLIRRKYTQDFITTYETYTEYIFQNPLRFSHYFQVFDSNTSEDSTDSASNETQTPKNTVGDLSGYPSQQKKSDRLDEYTEEDYLSGNFPEPAVDVPAQAIGDLRYSLLEYQDEAEKFDGIKEPFKGIELDELFNAEEEGFKEIYRVLTAVEDTAPNESNLKTVSQKALQDIEPILIRLGIDIDKLEESAEIYKEG